MTVEEMVKEYYPRLWNDARVEALIKAGKYTQEKFDEVKKEKSLLK